MEFEVGKQESLERVLKILEERIVELKDVFPQIIEGPTVAGVTKMGPTSVTVRITVKTVSEEHYAVERGIYKFAKTFSKNTALKNLGKGW